MPLSLRKTWLLPLLLLLAGCNTVVLNPAGDVARQQGDLIVVATVLMLIVIVPVIALTLFFAWRYRASNKAATYTPDWDHSIQLELVIWAVPLLIIIALGAITWITTHTLDPYRPLDRIDADRPLAEGSKPLEVQVVALDWKWLFIYPEQGIATVNELAIPVDRPVRFKLTASSVMNAFYVPELAGMIYTMPGMQTELNAVINKPLESEGFSANYSGAGFSHMRFGFHALDDAILNRCVDPRRMCGHEMMAIDAAGGRPAATSGLASLAPRERGDLRGRPFVPSAVCTADRVPAPLSVLALSARGSWARGPADRTRRWAGCAPWTPGGWRGRTARRWRRCPRCRRG